MMGKDKKRRLRAVLSTQPFATATDDNDAIKNFASQFSSPPICVRVGPKQKSYYLHHNLLCERCPYFKHRASFYSNSTAKELQDDVLVEIDDEFFDIFVQYLYTQEFNVPTDWSPAKSCHAAVRIYILADMWSMTDLKTASTEHMSQSLCEEGYHFSPVDIPIADATKLLRTVYEDLTTCEKPAGPGNTGNAVRTDEIESGRSGIWNLLEGANIQSDDQQNSELELALEAVPDAGLEIETTYADSGMLPSKKTENPVDRDEMRDLVLKYAAYRLDSLRQDDEFRLMVAMGGDLVVDLMSFLRPGSFP